MALDRPGKKTAVPHTEEEGGGGGGEEGSEGRGGLVTPDRDVLLHSCCCPSEL